VPAIRQNLEVRNLYHRVQDKSISEFPLRKIKIRNLANNDLVYMSNRQMMKNVRLEDRTETPIDPLSHFVSLSVRAFGGSQVILGFYTIVYQNE
jgi:hypothetical protein